MNEEKILKELNETIKSNNIDYETLRNAVETRKLSREIEGLKIGKVVAVISLFVSVLLLSWQGFQSYNVSVSGILDLHKTNTQTAIKKLEEELADKGNKKTIIETEIESLKGDKDDLEKSIKQKELIESEVEDWLIRKELLIKQISSFEKNIGDAQRIDEQLKKIEDANVKIGQLTRENEDQTIKLDEFEGVLKNYSDFGGYKSIVFKDAERKHFQMLNGYKVTFLSVGESKKNIDFTVKSPSGTDTKIVNLDQGFSYIFRFDKKLFYVQVQSVVQNKKDKSKQRGTFKIGVLDIDARLVY